jgi:predicted CoA-binding protein
MDPVTESARRSASDLAPQSDDALQGLLAAARTIAVVGIKEGESEDAFRVPRYLQEHGCRIVPVNPKLQRVLGERCVASLAEVDGPVDLVNLFRAPDHIPAHVDEILAMSPLPAAVWMQLGIVHGGAAARLRAAGIAVVQDRCIMVEHRRLGVAGATGSGA